MHVLIYSYYWEQSSKLHVDRTGPAIDKSQERDHWIHIHPAHPWAVRNPQSLVDIVLQPLSDMLCISVCMCVISSVSSINYLSRYIHLRIDTGGGNALNVRRTVKDLINVGAAGCFLEVPNHVPPTLIFNLPDSWRCLILYGSYWLQDQAWPKKCGKYFILHSCSSIVSLDSSHVASKLVMYIHHHL